MSQAVELKMFNRIYGHGRGWAFSKTDYVMEHPEGRVNQALSSLVKAGKIRRVLRGIYDYPTKNIGFKTPESGLLVQAITALGKNQVTPSVVSSIQAQIPTSKFAKILKETRSATTWVYDTIKKVCKEQE